MTVALATALASRIASATPSVRLDYDEGPGVAGCPPASRLREAVTSRLGEDPFDPAAQRSFQVEIAAVAAGLEGRVTLTDETGKVGGSRRFKSSAEHCAELVSAMALAISLAINPDLAEANEPPAEEAATPEPAPAGPDPIPGPPTSTALAPPSNQTRDLATLPPLRSTSRWTFALGAGVNAALGAGPAPALGAAAFGRIRHEAASLALEARFDAPFDYDVGSASVHTSLWAGALAPCLHVAFARGCWVALGGNVTAGSRGVTDRWQANGFFAATGPRLGVEWPILEPLSISAQLDGLVTVKPVRVVLDGRQVWRTPPVSAALAVAAVWQIP